MHFANNPQLKSWIQYSQDTEFPIQNIPFAIGLKPSGNTSVVTRIGDTVIDLAAIVQTGCLAGDASDLQFMLSQDVLNVLFEEGRDFVGELRNSIAKTFSDPSWKSKIEALNDALIPANKVELQIPVFIPNYTDFYSSKEHATNVGMMFRDPTNALLPNWLHIPVGYHGRSSSIIVSGTNVRRPNGQMKLDTETAPHFGPTKQLDFELEIAYIIGGRNEHFEPIKIEDAEKHIIGLVLFNDWSARDIQKWEYVPLGPFLGKNFASTISPWVVTLDALEPFRIEGPKQDPGVLPYLKTTGARGFDINLEAHIKTAKGESKQVSATNFKYMYWSMAQQLTHHTINGCNIETGDVYASGTISGPTPDSYGSMLEIAWKGTKPLEFKNGETRTFIEDGDTVSFKGFAQANNVKIGFGECKAKISPALKLKF